MYAVLPKISHIVLHSGIEEIAAAHCLPILADRLLMWVCHSLRFLAAQAPIT